MNLAHRLALLVSAHLKIRTRSEKPGLLGRSSSAFVSQTDWDEAFLVGQAAVRAAVAGHSGQMVTLTRESNSPYQASTGLTSLEAVAFRERTFPEQWRNAEGNGVSEGFAAYAAPLVGEVPHYPSLWSSECIPRENPK